jgi:hypothetical protein
MPLVHCERWHCLSLLIGLRAGPIVTDTNTKQYASVTLGWVNWSHLAAGCGPLAHRAPTWSTARCGCSIRTRSPHPRCARSCSTHCGIPSSRGWENRGAMPGRWRGSRDTQTSRYRNGTSTRQRTRFFRQCPAWVGTILGTVRKQHFRQQGRTSR